MSYDASSVILLSTTMHAPRKATTRPKTMRPKVLGVGERRAPPYTAAPAPAPVWVEVEPNGRVVIPIAMRRALGVESGGRLLFSIENERLLVMNSGQALRAVQDAVRPYLRGKPSMVDELIAERRAEARREGERR
jgi:bifunctional DNA-binding transcriptional regulator/antitoxin component of YhaV-PrlF toxin-antitoxin module